VPALPNTTEIGYLRRTPRLVRTGN